MSITTIIGPMFSGKTTEFIRLVDRKKIAGKRCLIIKHIRDDRFEKNDSEEKHIITHNQIRYKNCDIVYSNNLFNSNFFELITTNYDVVGVEEGFFFDDVANFCNELANNNIEVIVSTIDSSFKQEIFQEIGKLIAISENVIKLKAVCMKCKINDASFTIRTVDNDNEILVGGSDIYQSVCRNCLNNNRLDKKENKILGKRKKIEINQCAKNNLLCNKLTKMI
ncbi:thymidine kinase [Acanthamoeba polyphaga mimivirus]|uniref:Thymidine kinase n=6 Tax=Megamimivirinae TaxID=3044648 RepID=A0A2L2DLZ3_MIMIV|nr:thymidine kinase [Megavirus chiliensis]AEX61471.1 thymidine kinase [Megavirus courdo7]AFX92396.1 thymidine kinase [Megavirus courdo11]AGD92262.1 thymidine kinase [Megavirus lba]AUV58297.1 thymidine kinase [Bandra megavirus]AVG46087.1 thymidine kinase [Acanthamoeba polyphaga mimivirus]